MATPLTNLANAEQARYAVAAARDEAAHLQKVFYEAKQMKAQLEFQKNTMGAAIDQRHIDAIHTAIIESADKDRLDLAEAEAQRIFTSVDETEIVRLPPRPGSGEVVR